MAGAERRFKSKEEVLEFTAKYGDNTRAIIENWLTPENTEQAAKDWNGFARLIETAEKYKLTARVFKWLESREHAEQAAKDWDGFAELIEYAGKYDQTTPIFKWLENKKNLQNAAKHWKGFAKLLKYMKLKHRPTHPIFKWLKYSAQVRQEDDWGDFGKGLRLAIDAGQEEVMFEWLEDPANLKKATEHGEKFLILINRIGVSTRPQSEREQDPRRYQRLGIILHLLTTEDMEQTAKNWADYSDFKLIKRAATDAEDDKQHMLSKGLPLLDVRNRVRDHELIAERGRQSRMDNRNLERDNIRVVYNNIVFDWIENPEKLKEHASKWGFAEESKKSIVNWLENPEHVEHAKKDWLGFSRLANEAKETDRCLVIFTWLEDKKNLKKASPKWRKLADIAASAEDVGTLQTKLNRL